MAELTKIVNGEYIGADKYTITDTSDGKKQIVFSPDSVLKQGTPVGAEILNEIQKNGLYYLIGTHRVDGQESIYDCTLEGIDSFEFTQLCVLFKPDTTPTQSTIKLDISGQVYTLTGAKILNANQLGLILVKSELNAYVWSNYIKIVNDLTTGGANYALAAEQGVILNKKIDSLNICPYNVGDIFLTTNATNPSTVWIGTTWQKIENAMLRATSSGQASKQVGGSDTVALSVANLAPHTHSASTASHTHSRGTMNITGNHTIVGANESGYWGTYSGAFSKVANPNDFFFASAYAGSGHGLARGFSFNAANAWSGTTSGASPVTSVGSTGNGAAFSVVNRYYSVHVWLRVS